MTKTARRQPIAAENRCPGCGHPYSVIPLDGLCELCQFALSEPRTAKEDVSPYAERRETPGAGRGWWGMCKWVYAAGRQRIAHLGLMESSPASRRFARWAWFGLIVAACLFMAPRLGLHTVRVAPELVASAAPQPEGAGWIKLADRPRGPIDRSAVEIATAIWWNPVLFAIGLGATLLSSLLVFWAILALGRSTVLRGLGEEEREEGRLSAALDYSTAWAVPLMLAAVIELGLIYPRFAEVLKWPLQISPTWIHIPAAILAACAVLPWWFWLMRLGATLSPPSRGKAGRRVVVVLPLVAGIGVAGWYFGLKYGVQGLAQVWKLAW